MKYWNSWTIDHKFWAFFFKFEAFKILISLTTRRKTMICSTVEIESIKIKTKFQTWETWQKLKLLTWLLIRLLLLFAELYGGILGCMSGLIEATGCICNCWCWWCMICGWTLGPDEFELTLLARFPPPNTFRALLSLLALPTTAELERNKLFCGLPFATMSCWFSIKLCWCCCWTIMLSWLVWEGCGLGERLGPPPPCDLLLSKALLVGRIDATLCWSELTKADCCCAIAWLSESRDWWSGCCCTDVWAKCCCRVGSINNRWFKFIILLFGSSALVGFALEADGLVEAELWWLLLLFLIRSGDGWDE